MIICSDSSIVRAVKKIAFDDSYVVEFISFKKHKETIIEVFENMHAYVSYRVYFHCLLSLRSKEVFETDDVYVKFSLVNNIFNENVIENCFML